jgi:hypothetical protein
VPTIFRQIEVQVAPSVVRATWPHFVQSVITGSQRLACDEFACLDATSSGLVRFEAAASGGTLVVFTLDATDPEGPSPDVLEQHVIRDLVVFKDYVERGGNQVGRPTRAEKKAMLEDDTRRAHEPLRKDIGAEDEPVSYGDHFPT